MTTPIPADVPASADPVPAYSSELRRDLARALNRNSAETGSNTPDFVLAEFLRACLAAFDEGVRARAEWYGKPLDRPGSTDDRGGQGDVEPQRIRWAVQTGGRTIPMPGRDHARLVAAVTGGAAVPWPGSRRDHAEALGLLYGDGGDLVQRWLTRPLDAGGAAR